MPKMRSNRSAMKRFTKTASGKFKRAKAFKRHILTKKSPKTKRNLRRGVIVDKTNHKEVLHLCPYL